jgi:hypothetical protein
MIGTLYLIIVTMKGYTRLFGQSIDELLQDYG